MYNKFLAEGVINDSRRQPTKGPPASPFAALRHSAVCVRGTHVYLMSKYMSGADVSQTRISLILILWFSLGNIRSDPRMRNSFGCAVNFVFLFFLNELNTPAYSFRLFAIFFCFCFEITYRAFKSFCFRRLIYGNFIDFFNTSLVSSKHGRALPVSREVLHLSNDSMDRHKIFTTLSKH